ncbi:Trp biosynthesis-associated membrane protein [Phycicoccus sonneratiae]|uniref:Trp biosynthesis-associated membrane protein n=1 Tax=Phycicoccus sonneratiae TaxID=2807628 RepID=A0ABS2CHW7_9MICO|nr:Trp biosynthesis-associated membrane protein [Phycicoccus sonneraticus]MBM6399468.1 Trp biosynthesis-associated membrane protein [Phycicoccus sonneraticus]
MRRLTGKGPVALLALLGAGVVLVAGFRPWVSGTVADAVLGGSRVLASGSEVAPGLSAVALAVAAAAVAVVAAGRVARVVALVLWVVCLGTAGVLVGRVLADPSGVLGPVAAARVGRTGTVAATATATAWPWVAALGLVLAAAALAAAVVGRRRWAAPSRRYERTDAPEGHVAGSRGERVGTAWDDLSAGRDPTDVGDERRT